MSEWVSEGATERVSDCVHGMTCHVMERKEGWGQFEGRGREKVRQDC